MPRHGVKMGWLLLVVLSVLYVYTTKLRVDAGFFDAPALVITANNIIGYVIFGLIAALILHETLINRRVFR